MLIRITTLDVCLYSKPQDLDITNARNLELEEEISLLRKRADELPGEEAKVTISKNSDIVNVARTLDLCRRAYAMRVRS